jgi:hypothetical protein
VTKTSCLHIYCVINDGDFSFFVQRFDSAQYVFDNY